MSFLQPEYLCTDCVKGDDIRCLLPVGRRLTATCMLQPTLSIICDYASLNPQQLKSSGTRLIAACGM
ncbi:hypothetical protein TNCV_3348921 [Trichonephila clavipes]|nr:hypothetical protein TNCV_3348921 [Trichonephila clavipes]